MLLFLAVFPFDSLSLCVSWAVRLIFVSLSRVASLMIGGIIWDVQRWMRVFASAIIPSVRAEQQEQLVAHLDQSKFASGRQDQGHWSLAITSTCCVLYTRTKVIYYWVRVYKHDFVGGRKWSLINMSLTSTLSVFVCMCDEQGLVHVFSTCCHPCLWYPSPGHSLFILLIDLLHSSFSHTKHFPQRFCCSFLTFTQFPSLSSLCSLSLCVCWCGAEGAVH